jgi:integrase
MQDFLDFLKIKGLGTKTISDYTSCYKRFEKVVEEEGAEELTQQTINRFLLKHQSNVSRAFLKNFFIFHNIHHLNIPELTGRKKKIRRKNLGSFEVKVLRNYIYHNMNTRYLLLFDLSYYCALRRAEVMAIKVNDFDLIRWKEDTSKPCRLKILGKGRRERIVIVPPSLMHRIIDYIKETKEIVDKLFPFCYQEWAEKFHSAVKETMEYPYTPHDLRRARATKWNKEGLDITRIKTRLGHSSISTTELYINPDEEKELESWENEY